jgi:hypothetical protein
MSATDINGLVLASTVVLLVACAMTVIWPPPRRLTPQAELVLRGLARQFREELSQGAADSARVSGRRKAGWRDLKAEYRSRRLWPGKVAHLLAILRSRRSMIMLGAVGFAVAVPALPSLTLRFPAVAGTAGYIAVLLGALGIVLATRFLDKPGGRVDAVPMVDVARQNEPADRKLRRYSARVERATRSYARSRARKKDRMERITGEEIWSAWPKVVIPKADSPEVPAVRARAVLILSGAAVFVVAAPILYLVYVIAIPRLPISAYGQVAVIAVSLFALYWLLRKSEPLLGRVAEVSARLVKFFSAVLGEIWTFTRGIVRIRRGTRPAAAPPQVHAEAPTPAQAPAQAQAPAPAPAQAPATGEVDHSTTKGGTMAGNPLSWLLNPIMSIAQKLTGTARDSAQQKVQATATSQNGGDGVAEEATDLLQANPPSWPWVLFALLILAAGTLGAYFLWKWRNPADFVPSSNYATYAGLFIMALAIERILEPFSGLFVPSMKVKKAIGRSTVAQAKHTQAAAAGGEPHAAGAALAGPAKKEAPVPLKATPAHKAAVAQTELHRAQGARAVLMWATASVLAMLVCACLGIFLLRSVETPSPAPAKAGTTSSAPSKAKDPNRLLDLLVTGLVVGAGTKPLHDLISQVQTSTGSAKAKASSPANTG